MAYAPHETVNDAIKRAGLPKTHKINWTESRKEEVVRAVRDKLISFDEARWRYLLSHSEFRQWEQKVDARHSKPVKPKPPLEVREHSDTGGVMEEA